MNKYKYLVFLFCTSLFFIPVVNCVDYGSNTAVSIVAAPTISGATNNILAFGYMKNGFTLTDAETTCTFQSVFPVANTISLNNGILYLDTDFHMANPATFTSPGTFWGASHILEVDQTMNNFYYPSGSNVALSLISRVTVANSNPNSVDWSYDGNFLAVARSTGPVDDLLIYSFNGATLTLVAGVNLAANGNCVRWHPSTYCLVVGTAGLMQSYKFNGISTLTAGTSIATAAVSSLDFQGRGNYVAANLAPNTVSVFSYDSTSAGGTLTSVNSVAGGDGRPPGSQPAACGRPLPPAPSGTHLE